MRSVFGIARSVCLLTTSLALFSSAVASAQTEPAPPLELWMKDDVDPTWVQDPDPGLPDGWTMSAHFAYFQTRGALENTGTWSKLFMAAHVDETFFNVESHQIASSFLSEQSPVSLYSTELGYGEEYATHPSWYCGADQWIDWRQPCLDDPENVELAFHPLFKPTGAQTILDWLPYHRWGQQNKVDWHRLQSSPTVDPQLLRIMAMAEHAILVQGNGMITRSFFDGPVYRDLYDPEYTFTVVVQTMGLQGATVDIENYPEEEDVEGGAPPHLPGMPPSPGISNTLRIGLSGTSSGGGVPALPVPLGTAYTPMYITAARGSTVSFAADGPRYGGYVWFKKDGGMTSILSAHAGGVGTWDFTIPVNCPLGTNRVIRVGNSEGYKNAEFLVVWVY